MEAYGSLNSFDLRRHTVLSYFCLVTKMLVVRSQKEASMIFTSSKSNTGIVPWKKMSATHRIEGFCLKITQHVWLHWLLCSKNSHGWNKFHFFPLQKITEPTNTSFNAYSHCAQHTRAVSFAWFFSQVGDMIRFRYIFRTIFQESDCATAALEAPIYFPDNSISLPWSNDLKNRFGHMWHNNNL